MNTLVGYLKSKTFWVNVVGVIIQVVNAHGGQWFSTETGVIVQGALNLVVRALTTKPLSNK